MDITGVSLGVLNEAILAISGHKDFFVFWQSVCQNVKWLIPAKKISVILFSEDNQPYTVIQYEKGKVLEKTIPPTNNSFYQNLNLEKKGNWIENYQTGDEFFNWISNNGTSNVLSIPLKSNNSNLGMLLIGTNQFSDEDKKILITALSLYSSHIVTSYSLIKVIEDEKESKKILKQLVDDLAESEEKNKELLAFQEIKIKERTAELTKSEAKYKSLSESLEIKIEERTLELSKSELKYKSLAESLEIEVQNRTRELESEKEKLISLLKTAPAVIASWRDPDHIFEFANDNYYKSVGNRELIGKPIREAMPEIAGQGFYEMLDEVYKTGKPFIGKEVYSNIDKQGNGQTEDVYWNFTYQPIFNENNEIIGITDFAHDITEQVIARKELEIKTKELYVSEAKYKSLSESLEIKVQERTLELSNAKKEIEYERNKLKELFMKAPSYICILEGENHTFTFANPLYQKMFGENIIGKPIREALPVFEGQGYFELLDKVYQTGEPFIGHESPALFDRKGTGILSTCYFDFIYQPVFNSKHEIEGISAFIYDVTDIVIAREQVNKLYKEVQRSNDELQNFAYIASHDLQAPLRTVRSYTELLAKRAKDKLNEDELEFMEFITDGTKRMQQLISSLLEYSKIGSEKIEFSPVNLNKIIEIAIADLSNEINQNEASVIYTELPTLKVEDNHILRLFENLIGNSLKYRSNKKPEIKIAAKKENDYYQFSVSDNGIGIREKDQNKVFEIFQRLHDKEDVHGTGIGLANCRKIVELHGGKIWVESIEGEGSTFKFTIPVN